MRRPLAEVAPAPPYADAPGVRARPRDHRRFARAQSRRAARRRPAARLDPRGAGVRVPPCAARHAPAQRNAGAGRRRAVRDRGQPRWLPRARGRRAPALAAGGAGDSQTAALAASGLRRAGDQRAAHPGYRRGAAAALWGARAAQSHHLQHQRRERHAGARAAAQGGGAVAARSGAAAVHEHHPAVRDHRRPARVRRDHGRAAARALVPRVAGEPRQRPGDHARLLRQQQGRRLPHVELGALQGRGQAGGSVQAAWGEAAPVPRPRRHGGARAAARAIRRSSRSRPEPCSVRSASPSRAR